MAGVTLEGVLWIELAEAYAWLENSKIDTEGAVGIRFSVENDALQVCFTGGRVVEVDAAEFWAWVIDTQLPSGLAHYETLFGVPHEQGPDLVVTFALGSETHPRSWATPPACLGEWKQSAPCTA